MLQVNLRETVLVQKSGFFRTSGQIYLSSEGDTAYARQTFSLITALATRVWDLEAATL
jgi:hypothetical protein